MTFACAGSMLIRLRSACYAVVALAVTILFLTLSPSFVAPHRLGWPVLSVYIRTQIVLLRWICGLKYEVTGLEHLPDGPCIIASRHEATWETIFLPWLLNNPAVILKEEILHYPVVGLFTRRLGYIGVDRSGDLEAAKKTFETARAVSRTGRRVLIFPSGTRDPACRDRVQGGVGVLYRALKLPIVPITLNSGDHWCYRSWLRYPGTIRVAVLPAIAAGQPVRTVMAQLERDLSRPAFARKSANS